MTVSLQKPAFGPLKFLEKTGHITVERKVGKNQLVTLNWLPSQE
jgi:hypothetical protein